MFFIIQNEPFGRDVVQNAIFIDVLNHYKYSHSYELISSRDFYKEIDDSMQQILKEPSDFDERFQEAIRYQKARSSGLRNRQR